jgi:hypothetical protein
MFSRDDPVYNECRLCGSQAKLCNSHLHPKFYWEWLQRTGSKYFRRSDQPNLRFQDGYKLPMLCLACEGRFSEAETVFAAEMFRPLVADSAAVVTYSDPAVYCLISILWRCLAYDIDSGQAGQISEQLYNELLDAEAEWREFLQDKRQLLRFNKVHLFITDFPTNDSPQINQYMSRDVDGTAMWTQTKVLGLYTKFGRFIVVSEMKDFNSAKWINTLLDPNGGVFDPGSTRLLDGRFGEFLLDRAAKARNKRREFYSTVSAKQEDAIRRNEERMGEQFEHSDLRRAQVSDAIWDSKIPKVGRNDPCPCQSGIKYKKCHGFR